MIGGTTQVGILKGGDARENYFPQLQHLGPGTSQESPYVKYPGHRNHPGGFQGVLPLALTHGKKILPLKRVIISPLHS